MRIRPFVAIVSGILLSLVATVGVLSSPAQAFSDGDADGLDDSLEDTLAARYFPHIWFDSGENYGCTEPATPWNHGTAVARVRPHPQNGGLIAVSYAVLFRKDCGDLWGFSSHNGDVEPFSLTLAPNGGCADGYGVHSLKTISHEGTWAEHVDERFLGNSCTWGRLAGGSPYDARIYSSENKHGLYASDASCDAGVGGLDNCSESFTLNYNVINVGEDHARRVDELSGYQFPGEYAWSPVPFRGSLGGGSDAGLVRDKLTADRLLAPAVAVASACPQRTHVWYENPGRAESVEQGGSILLAARGVAPGTTVSYDFVRPDGTVAARHVSKAADSACVAADGHLTIDASTFPAGRYDVVARYHEGALARTAYLMDLDVRQ